MYWTLIKVDFEKKKNARHTHISSKVVNLECKTQHAVITHANTSNGIKIPTFFEKSS